MRKIFQIIFLIIILGCKDKVSSSQKDISIDTLSYSYHGFNHHRELFLLSNKKFTLIESSASCFGDYKIYRHFGTYKENDSTISIHPKKVEIETFSTIMELDTIYKIPYSDSLKVKTTYQKFKWNDKQYLLSEQMDSIVYPEFRNDYEEFAYSYNIGEEPGESGNYLTRKIKSIDSLIEPIKLEKIPKQYRDQFLEEPISAKIIDRKKLLFEDEYEDNELTKWRVKLNKGSEDGLRKGMYLTTSDSEFFIFIDSISTNNSYGECYVYNIEEKYSKIGTEMKTRWNN